MDGQTDEVDYNIPFTFLNKRALGPWVAHLRMIVYKGIGKHSSSQSQAMNFDRSAVTSRVIWTTLTE